MMLSLASTPVEVCPFTKFMFVWVTLGGVEIAVNGPLLYFVNWAARFLIGHPNCELLHVLDTFPFNVIHGEFADVTVLRKDNRGCRKGAADNHSVCEPVKKNHF
jgi:hypothetical protein